jgi:Uma2 family endonuclease
MKPPRTPPQTAARPELHSGDRMLQPEFHRRYEQQPDDARFELIAGVVYMASPARVPHSTYAFELNLVLGLYKSWTPGVEGAEGPTTILGEKNEPQPDLILRLLPGCGGQSRSNADEYIERAPELVVEVAHSTRAIDMNRKRQVYLAAGVLEYLVLCVEEQELHWFHFPSKRKLKPDRTGVWKSRVFPGLWLHGPALLAKDSLRLIETVQQGLAAAEHAAFVTALQQPRPS